MGLSEDILETARVVMTTIYQVAEEAQYNIIIILDEVRRAALEASRSESDMGDFLEIV